MLKFKQSVATLLIVGQFLLISPITARAELVAVTAEDPGLGMISVTDGLESLAAEPNTVVLDEATLERSLLSGNMDVLNTMQTVLKTRDQMNIARGELLPSISLSMILAAFASPFFLLNSVSCLVPFLFPSNWYNLKASKKEFHAQIEALHLMKMNAFAAAQALVYQVAGDEAVLDVMTKQRTRLAEYNGGLEQQYALGLLPEIDIIRSRIEMGRVENDLLKTRQLVLTERSLLRKMLGIPLTKTLVLRLAPMTPSRLEGGSPATLLASVHQASPERVQLELVYEAAKAKVGSTGWSFLSGCSGSQGSLNVGALSYGSSFNLSTGAGMSLGFGYFPKLKLAKRSLKDIELRQKELELELGHVLESTVPTMNLLKERQRRTQANLEMTERMLSEQLVLLDLGRVSVKEVLESFSVTSMTQIELVATNTALASTRITLKRTGVEERFLKILNDSRRETSDPNFGKKPRRNRNS